MCHGGPNPQFWTKKSVIYSENDCETKTSLVPGHSSTVLFASLSVINYVQNVDVIWCSQTISNNRLFCRLKLDHPPLYLAMIVRWRGSQVVLKKMWIIRRSDMIWFSLMTSSWVLHYLFVMCSWHVHYLSMASVWPVHVFFMTC